MAVAKSEAFVTIFFCFLGRPIQCSIRLETTKKRKTQRACHTSGGRIQRAMRETTLPGLVLSSVSPVSVKVPSKQMMILLAILSL